MCFPAAVREDSGGFYPPKKKTHADTRPFRHRSRITSATGDSQSVMRPHGQPHSRRHAASQTRSAGFGAHDRRTAGLRDA